MTNMAITRRACLSGLGLGVLASTGLTACKKDEPKRTYEDHSPERKGKKDEEKVREENKSDFDRRSSEEPKR